MFADEALLRARRGKRATRVARVALASVDGCGWRGVVECVVHWKEGKGGDGGGAVWFECAVLPARAPSDAPRGVASWWVAVARRVALLGARDVERIPALWAAGLARALEQRRAVAAARARLASRHTDAAARAEGARRAMSARKMADAPRRRWSSIATRGGAFVGAPRRRVCG